MSSRDDLYGSVPIPDPTKLTTDAVALAKEELTSTFSIQLKSIRELYDEKLRGVGTEFTMRDIALAAAFKAAEAQVKQQNESNSLAADKAAAAFTKQIDGLDEKINDLKERMAEIHTRNYASLGGYLVGAISVIYLIVTILRRTV